MFLKYYVEYWAHLIVITDYNSCIRRVYRLRHRVSMRVNRDNTVKRSKKKEKIEWDVPRKILNHEVGLIYLTVTIRFFILGIEYIRAYGVHAHNNTITHTCALLPRSSPGEPNLNYIFSNLNTPFLLFGPRTLRRLNVQCANVVSYVPYTEVMVTIWLCGTQPEKDVPPVMQPGETNNISIK